MKKLLLVLFFIFLVTNPVKADDSTFATHYNLAEQYFSQAKYTNAIGEYQKALRINYLDNSARIGLINSYLARAVYYTNTLKDFEKAANDYRSALFYMEVYPDAENMQTSSQVASEAKDRLEECFQLTNFDKSAYSRYKTADKIRNNGLNDYAAAAYEFFRAAKIGDDNICKNANRNIGDIIKSRTGNYAKAADFYQQALTYAPNDSGLHNLYAQMLMKINKEDLAIEEFNKALANASNPTYILFNLEKLYGKKLKAKPNDITTLVNFGSILQQQGKETALDYYKKAEALNPNNELTLLKLGSYYQDKGDSVKALEYYNSALKINPNNTEAHYYIGTAYLKSGNKDKAIEEFKTVLKSDPNHADAQHDLLLALEGVMTPAELLKYLSGNNGITQSAVNTMYNYAIDLHKNKNAKAAVNYYREILKYKQSPEIYTNLALAQVENKNENEAIKILISAKEKYPDSKQILDILKEISQDVNNQKYQKAADYFKNNDFQKALELYKSIQPETAESTLAIAACYKSLNNIDQALYYYKKALEYNPNNSEIAYYIGVLYTELENWTSAKINLQNALKINPNNEKAQELLASVIEQNNILLINKVIENYNKNNYEEALKLISQVLTEDNNNAYAHYYRGLIYDAQKKYTLAIEEYKKSYINNPNLVVSNYLIAIIYDTQAQYSNALSYYKKFVEANKENDEYKAYAQSRIADLKEYEK